MAPGTRCSRHRSNKALCGPGTHPINTTVANGMAAFILPELESLHLNSRLPHGSQPVSRSRWSVSTSRNLLSLSGVFNQFVSL
jgi:hypothetical protein